MNDMTMGSALPGWLTPVAWAYLALAVVAALAIAVDVYGPGHRQRLRAMELVWVASALWLGPLALPLYARLGRATGATSPAVHSAPAAVATTGSLPGGAASLVAHLIGVPLVLAAGWTIAGLDLWVMILVIAALATALLAVFEHTARRRTATAAGGSSVAAALVVATVTVLAFDLGMGGWMLLLHFNDLMPEAGDIRFTFLMQIGIALGFLTGYPAVNYLIRRGLKPAV